MLVHMFRVLSRVVRIRHEINVLPFSDLVDPIGSGSSSIPTANNHNIGLSRKGLSRSMISERRFGGFDPIRFGRVLAGKNHGGWS